MELKEAANLAAELYQELNKYKHEAEAGRALYKFMDKWFAKYSSTSKAVKALHKYEKQTGIEERNADSSY